MLEYLINDEEARARELFHDIVVAKSREIYENLLADDFDDETEESRGEEEEGEEENMGMGGDMQPPEEPTGMEAFGGDETDDMLGDVEADDDEMGDMGDDDMGDMGEEDTADRLDDLEAELEALRADFEEKLGGGDEMDMGGDDMGDMGGDDMGDMGGDEEPTKDSMYYEASEDDEDESEDEDEDDEKTDEDFIREYVEKVGGGNYNTWGKMGDDGVNTKSPIAKPNRMGGTSENILGNRNGQAPVEVGAGRKIQGNGVFNQTPQDLVKGEVHNRPGKTDAGKKAFKKKEPGHGAEKKGEAEGKAWGAGTGGAAGQVGNLNTKSPLNGAPQRAK